MFMVVVFSHMLSYTTYSEAGGVGKTTTAANLAVAHARAGLDVLVIPLDPQEANLSRLFDVDEDRSKDIDTLPHHMVGQPKGSFDDLAVTTEYGVDIIPEHDNHAELSSWLRTAKKQADQIGESFEKLSALLNVLKENQIVDEYDVVICDPPATEGVQLHNAINATRNLVMPIEPSSKGAASMEGLRKMVEGLQEQLGIDVGVLAAIPTAYSATNDQQAMVETIDYDTPATIGDRTSLMEGCWAKQGSAFSYIKEHRTRVRDYEIDTLEKFDEMARFIEAQSDVEAPSPPEPATLGEEMEVGQ
jgi:cellulose biosynthesis protein BcsQ